MLRPHSSARTLLMLVGVIALLAFAHILQFWKFYSQGLIPFPGDILVGFYFPWSSGGFAGFDPFTQYKAQNTVDVIKQMYPWRDFAFEMLKKGQWPLWNPYNFSGMPFIANLQSAVFFPGHALSLFVPSLVGWIVIIVAELFFFGGSLYVFLRSQALSRLAALFGAIVGMNLSYIVLWHEQLVISESLLLLPLILYLVNRYKATKAGYHLLFISFLLTFSLFGGHAQTGIYIYAIFFLFALYRRVPLLKLILISALPILLGAIQLFPSLEAYLLSAREGKSTKDLFAAFVFPWSNLITLFAPDFFGHPTTRNEWATYNYRDFCAYIGFTAAIFSFIGVFIGKHHRDARFFVGITLSGLLLATPPFVFLFDIFNVPILSSGVPARMIFVFQFGLGILAAYGFQGWLSSLRGGTVPTSLRLIKGVLLLVGVIMIGLWGGAYIERTHWIVTRNNLILPTLFYIVSCAFIIAPMVFKKLTIVATLGIIVLAVFQYSLFVEKFDSFSNPTFAFPSHPILSFLKENGGMNRFYGVATAEVNYNFSAYYRLYDPQGYDSMYPKRYGEFAASTITGQIPEAIPRSDAFYNHWQNKYTQRAFDIMGIRYFLDKNDEPKASWEVKSGAISPDKGILVWQKSKWKVYERPTVLERIKLFDHYTKIVDKSSILSQLYHDDFDYHSELILEEDPSLMPQEATFKKVTILAYEPNTIRVITESDAPQLLFLSDNYYPGWKVTIDGTESKIYRANYTFRAVAVPEGRHTVVMEYQPRAFALGLLTTLVTGIGTFLVSIILLIRSKKKRQS